MLDDFLGWLFSVVARLFYWLFSTIVSLVVNAISAARQRRRLARFARFAQRNGLTYQPEAPGVLGQAPGAPFHHPGSSTGFGAVSGQLGRWPFLTSEYRYVLEGANFEFDRYLRVTLIRLPTTLPPLEVAPEGRFSQLFPGLAPMDLDIENHQFNRAFRVSVARETEARRFAVAVLNPRAVEALLRFEPFCWRIYRNEVIAWWPVDLSPRETMARVEALSTLVEGIPPFLWSDVGGRVDWTPVVRVPAEPPPNEPPPSTGPPPAFKDVLRSRESGPAG